MPARCASTIELLGLGSRCRIDADLATPWGQISEQSIRHAKKWALKGLSARPFGRGDVHFVDAIGPAIVLTRTKASSDCFHAC